MSLVLKPDVGQRGSASLRVAPDAAIDDGRLDVVVLRRHSIVGFLRFAAAVLRGDPPPEREASVGQAERITVGWARPVSLQCDGDGREPAATTAYSTQLAALRVMLPE